MMLFASFNTRNYLGEIRAQALTSHKAFKSAVVLGILNPEPVQFNAMESSSHVDSLQCSLRISMLVISYMVKLELRLNLTYIRHSKVQCLSRS